MGVAQVDVRVVAGLLGGGADGGHERQPGCEVRRGDPGLQAVVEVDPAGQALAGDLLSGESRPVPILADMGQWDEPPPAPPLAPATGNPLPFKSPRKGDDLASGPGMALYPLPPSVWPRGCCRRAWSTA